VTLRAIAMRSIRRVFARVPSLRSDDRADDRS
jgi:hypothetical protein